MSYTLYDMDGETPVYVYHSDRSTCDDAACPCALPKPRQLVAQRRADSRREWYVSVPDGDLGGSKVLGPMGEPEAREWIADAARAKLLRVIEDYS